MDLELKKITHDTKGVALLVSNSYDGEYTLDGTYLDAKKMTSFLIKCKYVVIWYHNLDKEFFIKFCKKLAKYEYPETCRRLLVGFSGHGNNGVLIFQDIEEVTINDLVTMFKPNKNPILGSMVRMFIIDACRGNQKDFGCSFSRGARSTIKGDIDLCKGYPNDANMLVAYSTTQHHVSIEEETGGIWMTYLLEELEDPHEDLLSILVKVNGRLKNKFDGEFGYQTGECSSTLSEKVYFKKEAGLEQGEAGLEQREAALKQGKAALEQREAALEQEKAALEQEKAALKQGKAALEQGEAGLEQEKAALEQGKAALEQGKAALEQQEAALEQEKAALEQEKAALEQGGAGLEQGGAGLEQEKAALEQGGAGLEQGKAALEQQEAALEQQEAALEQWEAALEQREPALEQGGAGLEQGKAALEQHEAAVEQWEAALEQSEAALEQGKAALKRRRGYEYGKEMLKGVSKAGGTQILGSIANDTAIQCAKEISRRAVGQGAKAVAVQGAKAVAKQAVVQTAKVAAPIGLAIEGVCWGYEINSAHNKKKRGEITEEEFHDIIVEQTATSGGSAAGGIGGAVAGATAGAVVGSVIPLAGTVIGGAIGGFIGGIFGGLGGSLAGKGAGKVINYARH